jgi:hypothetical protein
VQTCKLLLYVGVLNVLILIRKWHIDTEHKLHGQLVQVLSKSPSWRVYRNNSYQGETILSHLTTVSAANPSLTSSNTLRPQCHDRHLPALCGRQRRATVLITSFCTRKACPSASYFLFLLSTGLLLLPLPVKRRRSLSFNHSPSDTFLARTALRDPTLDDTCLLFLALLALS